MNIDITLPDDRASIVSAIANMIQSSLDDKSVRQHAELILDEYIVRTNHHIWMVGQCAKILKEVVIKYYHDTEMFDTNIEFHDYDKLHNPDILPECMGCARSYRAYCQKQSAVRISTLACRRHPELKFDRYHLTYICQ